MPVARALLPVDRDSLRAVAAACDQVGVLSVTDDRYLSYVQRHGGVSVCGDRGAVQGYAGQVDVGDAAYLTDLFVHPEARDGGVGRALLTAAWDGRSGRLTSSSQDPRALAGYGRFGARPRWPLLYLHLPGEAPAATTATTADIRDFRAGDAGWSLELDGLVTVTTPDGAAAAVVVRRDRGNLRVLRARTPEPLALVDVVDGLRRRAGPGGTVSVVVPGPHPALPALLERGARIGDMDMWCAADDVADLVDPTRELPSPALA